MPRSPQKRKSEGSPPYRKKSRKKSKRKLSQRKRRGRYRAARQIAQYVVIDLTVLFLRPQAINDDETGYFSQNINTYLNTINEGYDIAHIVLVTKGFHNDNHLFQIFKLFTTLYERKLTNFASISKENSQKFFIPENAFCHVLSQERSLVGVWGDGNEAILAQIEKKIFCLLPIQQMRIKRPDYDYSECPPTPTPPGSPSNFPRTPTPPSSPSLPPTRSGTPTP